MGNTPTPLRHAIRTDDVDFLNHLLTRAGTKAPDLINKDHSPDCILQSCSQVDGNALYFAVSKSRTEIVKILLRNGGDIYTTGLNGETCLHCSARNNSVDIAKILIEAGCNVNETDDYGHYPIHSAGISQYNTTNMINFLLKEVGNEADVNLKDYFDNTPLHMATSCNNVAVMETLISLGANVNAPNKRGDTPLHCCKKDSEAWKLLLSNGAEIVANAKGWMPGEIHSDSEFGAKK